MFVLLSLAARADDRPAGSHVQLGSTRTLLPRELYYTDLSPDGRTVVYVEDARSLVFCDLCSGTTQQSVRFVPGYEAPGYQARVLVPAAGKNVATLESNRVVVWDAVTGAKIAQVKVAAVSNDDTWTKAAFSSDGKRLAVCRGRQMGRLTYAVWDVDQDKAVTEITVPNTNWAYLAFSPDGKWLATWETLNNSKAARPEDDPNLRIIVWDADSGKEAHRFQVFGGADGHKVCFSPDGKTAAVIGTWIELWDTATWKKRREVRGNKGYWPNGTACEFSPDGKRLAILLGDGTIDVRDGGTADPVMRVLGYAPGHTFRFTAPNRIVVVGGEEKNARAWEVPSRKPITPGAGHVGKVCHVTFTPDGKQVLSVSEDGVLIRWDVATGKPVPGGGLAPVDYEPWVGRRERLEYVSPDGGRGIFTTYWNYTKPGGRKARVFDLHARKEIFGTARDPDSLWGSNLSCSADGTRMLLNPGYRSGYPVDTRHTAIWDMATGRKLCEFPQRDTTAVSAYFAPDGRHVVVVTGRGYDRVSRLQTVVGEVWSTEGGKLLITCESIKKSEGKTAGLSPDGRTLVISSSDRQSVFELPSGRLRLEASDSRRTPLSPVVFSPDGRLFAIGQGADGDDTGTVQLWETTSGSIRHSFEGHSKRTAVIAFSPNGRLLASGSHDSTVIIWDLGLPTVPEELLTTPTERLWQRLAVTDAAEAWPVIAALVARPTDAVTFIEKNLPPAKPLPAAADIKKLIAALDAPAFRDRETASRALINLGREAEPLARDALKAERSGESDQRLQEVLKVVSKPGATPEEIRSARAVEVLERVGTTEAIAVLRRLADGTSGRPLTDDARGAVNRLSNNVRK